MAPKTIKAKAATPLERPNTPISQGDQLATKNFLLMLGAITAAVVLVGGYLIYVLSGQYIHKANEVKAQDQLITTLNKKITDLNTLKPAYASITTKSSGSISDGDLVLRAVPITQDYSGLIASLEKIAQQSDVKVTSVSQSNQTSTVAGVAPSASQTSTSANPNTLSFTINIQGPYDKIFTFLQNTERSARVINFSNMTLSGNSGVVTSSLSMRTYWQPPANIKSTMRPLK